MKRILLFAICLCSSLVVQAQIGYRGQSAISIGMAKTNCGYLANIRFENHLTARTVLGGELLFNSMQLATTDADHFNVRQGFAGFVYQFPLIFGRWSLSPSASALLGGEFADRTTSNGNLLQMGNGFIFGFSVNMPVGIIIGRRIAIYVDPRMIILPTSAFEKSIFSIGGGVKCYF